MFLQHQMQLHVNAERVIGRRDFLGGVSAAALAGGTLNWADVVRLQASTLRKQGMACILLWMAGGPSQFDTFDPKPEHANGAGVKGVATKIPGVQFSEHLPKLAKVADQLAIVRSMTTKEGEHQRASYMLHTSYLPTASVNYPTLGSVVAREIRDSELELPSFVRVGRAPNGGGGGLLGAEFDPLSMISATRLPDNTTLSTDKSRYQRRRGLMSKLEAAAGPNVSREQIEENQKVHDQAAKMILSPHMQAFDVSRESEAVRDAYGRSEFATGCLLARRLVEQGVTFVEVALGNWDTHQDNNSATQNLCGQLDQPFAYLIEDLKQRGLLDRTLVVWMGEFGRTPRINPRNGRDHYPRAFSAAIAGAGVRTGQVLGATGPGGDEVTGSPVTEKDWFQTIYTALKIDPQKENMSPIGRPIKLVDGGSVVKPLLG